MPQHVVEPLGPMEGSPAGFELGEVCFDPKVHLQLEPPSTVTSMKFEQVSFPYKEDAPFQGFAYSEPFRVLSDEGIRAARAEIDANEKFAGSTKRIKKCLRGLAYRSPLMRDLASSPEINGLLSAIANQPIAQHTLPMNVAHTNFSVPGSGKAVDPWHTDSVDYVFVLIMSDQTGARGGDLEVLQMPDASDGKEGLFDRLQREGVPRHLVKASKYPGPGYGIFMHGSKILHQVTPVEWAPEPRISVVNSYVSLNPFDPDTCRFSTYADNFGDPAHITYSEYSRHTAWRVGGQLDYVLKRSEFKDSRAEMAELFENSAAELKKAARLLSGQESDKKAWIELREDSDSAQATSSMVLRSKL